MGLSSHESETIQPDMATVSTTPEEKRMNASQSAPIARAVGASGAQAVEQRHNAEFHVRFDAGREHV